MKSALKKSRNGKNLRVRFLLNPLDRSLNKGYADAGVGYIPYCQICDYNQRYQTPRSFLQPMLRSSIPSYYEYYNNIVNSIARPQMYYY